MKTIRFLVYPLILVTLVSIVFYFRTDETLDLTDNTVNTSTTADELFTKRNVELRKPTPTPTPESGSIPAKTFEPEYKWDTQSRNNERAKYSGTVPNQKERTTLSALSETIGELFGTTPEVAIIPDNKEQREPNITAKSSRKEQSGQNPRRPRNVGVRTGSALSAPTNEDLSEAASSPTPTVSASPTPTPTPEYPWVSGQTRGYTMLYAMQPQARATVESEIENLLEAQIREVYLGVLTDGTFGWDPEYLANLIQRLNQDDRRLTLGLFITNGATMRRFDTTPITTDFSRIDPIDFRELIQNDSRTQETYKNLVQRVLPLFALNQNISRTNRNIVVPMLEDNLDRTSYRAIADLTENEIGTLATIVRNPCPECIDGNDVSRLDGTIEVHGVNDLRFATVGDSFSLDGSGYHLPGETPFDISLSVEDVLGVLDAGLAIRFNYFGLWRADRQGLTSGASVHPDERTYAIPTAQQLETEREMLRYGLELETTDP